MKSVKSFLTLILVLASGLFPTLQAQAQDQVNSQITPVITVAPNLFPVGQFSNTFVCVSNGNPSSTKPIQTGDTFKLTFDYSIGVVAAVASPVLVNSANLSAADFTASLGTIPNQIVITYRGATKVFQPGDSFCVKVSFMANSVIGSGKITGEAIGSSGDTGRYNGIDPKYTTISIVDFAVGPAGPQGPPGPQGPKGLNWKGAWSGAVPYVTDDAVSYNGSSWRAVRSNSNVTPVEGADWTIIAQKGDTGPAGSGSVLSVSANSPLTVTNATTTPNISLGVVPAGNGGTGLNSAGVAGNFLRSNGGGWTSGALTAADLPAGSTSYVQNGTSQQANTSFNISGNGTAAGTLTGSIVNAVNQVNINGSRAFTINGAYSNSGTVFTASNTFAGDGAGINTTPSSDVSNDSGKFNSFFGAAAGGANTTGYLNSFFGATAGSANTTGLLNSFFGYGSGRSNTTGNGNAFFGYAGLGNTTGTGNSYFGVNVGSMNTGGNGNAFFGNGTGPSNTGSFNAFFGINAGLNHSTGNFNAFFGASAGILGNAGNYNTMLGSRSNASNNLTNATAVGANAYVTQSNSLVLGSINGVNDATADTSVGIGTTAPQDKLHVNGIIRVDTLGVAGSTQLCRNASNQIATCSSSLRYKTNISPFIGGMEVIKRLRPITFTWKEGGMRDLGFGAEEVAKVEPLFTFTNEQGQIEGVKYDRINVALVNAMKELSTENDTLKQQVKEQQAQLRRQQQQIEAVTRLVCASNPAAKMCKAARR